MTEVYFLIVSEAGKSQIKVLANLISGEGLSSWLTEDHLLTVSSRSWERKLL